MPGQLQQLFSGFRRLQDFPLDESSVYENLESAERYCSSDRRAYLGQLLGIYSGDDMGVYQIVLKDNHKQLMKLSNSESVIKALQEINERLLSIDNFLEEETLNTYIDNTIKDKYATKDELEDAVYKIMGSERVQEQYDTIKEIADRIDEINQTLSFTVIQSVTDDPNKVSSSAAVRTELDELDAKIGCLTSALETRLDGKI